MSIISSLKAIEPYSELFCISPPRAGYRIAIADCISSLEHVVRTAPFNSGWLDPAKKGYESAILLEPYGKDNVPLGGEKFLEHMPALMACLEKLAYSGCP